MIGKGEPARDKKEGILNSSNFGSMIELREAFVKIYDQEGGTNWGCVGGICPDKKGGS